MTYDKYFVFYSAKRTGKFGDFNGMKPVCDSGTHISTWLNLALRLLWWIIHRISHMGWSINRYCSLLMNIFLKFKDYIDFWISLKWWEFFVRLRVRPQRSIFNNLKKTIRVKLKWHYLTSIVSQYKTYISVLKLTIDSNHRFLDF